MIKIIVIGPLKTQFIINGVNQFLKWNKPYCKLELIEIPLTKNMNSTPRETYTEKDYQKIKKYFIKDSYNIVMDERGKNISSVDFSQKISDIKLLGKKGINIFIGGPRGHSKNIYDKADFILGLSKMTFTHEMAVLLILEQIYRTNKILNNEKYHY